MRSDDFISTKNRSIRDAAVIDEALAYRANR